MLKSIFKSCRIAQRLIWSHSNRQFASCHVFARWTMTDDLTPLTALGLRWKTAEEFARKMPTLPLGFQTHLLPLLSPELPAPIEIIIHASVLRAWPWKTTEHVCPLVSRMNLTVTHTIPSVTEYGLDSTAAASIWLTFTQNHAFPYARHLQSIFSQPDIKQITRLFS